MTRFCLNAIVRNESARILRMLDSVKDYVSCIAILDTGSSDDTPNLIETYGRGYNIPTCVAHGTFVNFEQARNQALDLGRDWARVNDADYLLLVDADMQLTVSDMRAFENLDGEAYEMLQRAGGTSYHNIRLLKRTSPCRYVGVTHEYLSAPTSGVIGGAEFIDHADGSNRANKFERDIALLTADLVRDPNNARTWYYLANSYRDAGQYDKAIDAYRRRVELGDWDEERWNAQVHLAGCLKAQGLNDAFVAEALRAYQMRPQRAEVLHDLAKHFREAGQQATAMLFAERGLKMERPDDRLFVCDWVYEWGFREEVSIAAFYQEDTRELGYKVSNDLALDPKVPDHVRGRARRDMVWYLPKLKDICPSAKFTEINFQPRRGYTAMNPCITNDPDGDLEVLLRTVNYKIDAQGRYMIGETECGDAPIETENWLLWLDKDLNTVDYSKVAWDRPEPKFPLVLGLEDMRIFWRGEKRHFYANVREQREDGQCIQYHGQLHAGGEVISAIPISDGYTVEKNWAPFLYGGPEEELVYRLDTLGVVLHHVVAFEKMKRTVAVDNISGSSQWIPFAGGMLSVVHEAIAHPATGKRVYQHRLAFTDTAFGGLKLSLPFVFLDVQIEFCSGIAKREAEIIISFGERDEKAMLVVVAEKDIRCALGL